MKTIIIATSNASADDQDFITKFLEGKPSLNVWHWHSDLWIVVRKVLKNAVDSETEVNELYDELEAAGWKQRARLLIIEAGEIVGVSGLSNRESWDWFRKHWKLKIKNEK